MLDFTNSSLPIVYIFCIHADILHRLSVFVKGEFVILWKEWFKCVFQLRGACSRRKTFMWMALAIACMAIRPDLLGVTSLVRACLDPFYYHALLHLFHSNALSLDLLLQLWIRLILQLFVPVVEGKYIVFVADGLKNPKEGKKMPAVKYLHQESGNNSKSEFIMGHSFQAISLLVYTKCGNVSAIPIVSRISEGLSFGKRKTKSLLDKLVILFMEVAKIADVSAILVADAYYASKNVIHPLLVNGHHLITRVRSNAVAYKPVSQNAKTKKKRGRPKQYGTKVSLSSLFSKGSFIEANSPVYGEENVTIKYLVIDLLWRPVGHMVRFVLVIHPVRGRIILLSSSMDFEPLSIIKIYGWRFKIEVSFKQAINTIGKYNYHFWMMSMDPIKRGTGNQNLSGKSDEYLKAISRKMDAYHRYVQIGCIVQGLLKYLAINFRKEVWANFASWLRTMKKDLTPSEMVVAISLRSSFPHFLMNNENEPEMQKFFEEHLLPEKILDFKLVA